MGYRITKTTTLRDTNAAIRGTGPQELAQQFIERDPALPLAEIEAFLEVTAAASAVATAYKWSLKRLEFGTQLSGARSHVLRLLFLNEDHCLPQYELGETLNITSSAVTYLVDMLEEAGFVSRRIDLDDRRVTFVGLTAEGKLVASQLVDGELRFISKLLEDFDDSEKALLSNLLGRLRDRASRYSAAAMGKTKE